jgi:predicted flavoprotein YhiN
VFPVSNSAKDVVDALLQKVRSVNVQIKSDMTVKRVSYNDGKVVGVEETNGEFWRTKNIILATGGKSVPHTGSPVDIIGSTFKIAV